MEKVVNQDYIAVIQQDGDKLVYSKLPTQYDLQFVEYLQGAVQDDAISFEDIQKSVINKYGQLMDKEYRYASTYSYKDSFVSSVKIPKEVSPDEYKKRIHELSHSSITEPERRKLVAERQFKRAYVRDVTRFIYAMAYSDAVRRITIGSALGNDPIRVMSTETRGFDVHQFKVTDDIDIIVRSNFCYGESSYMNFSLRYKDVLITPYSDYVSYYYARMYSIIKCTRDYEPRRNNWKHMLEFVVELCNMATNDYEAFIHKWLIEEVDKMIKGLLDIYNNTSSYVKKISKLSNKDIDFSYIRIALISGMSHRNIMVSDDEVELSFLSEKLTGALGFIENLKKASLLDVDESEAVKTILQLNISILTRLEKCIANVGKDIERLEPIVREREEAFNEAEAAVSKYKDDLMKDRSFVETFPNYPKKSQYTDEELKGLLSLYLRDDEAFLKLKENAEEARKVWAKESIQLDRRKHFKSELEGYVEQINQYKDLAL